MVGMRSRTMARPEEHAGVLWLWHLCQTLNSRRAPTEARRQRSKYDTTLWTVLLCMFLRISNRELLRGIKHYNFDTVFGR